MSKNAKGNILFLILIAVALFGALAYAATQGARVNDQGTSKERAKISQGEFDSYSAQINQAMTRLEVINHCSYIDYTPPAEQTAGDKSCHIFHPDGGGVAYRQFTLGVGCNLDALALGESCNGVVFAGTSFGDRLYTTIADQGYYSWNNGLTGAPNLPATTATSTSDGTANTDALIAWNAGGEPYKAAQACRLLGDEWFLPSVGEMNVLYQNREIIGNFNLSGTIPDGYYATSTEHASNTHMRAYNFAAGNAPGGYKWDARPVRCIRR